MEVPTMTDAPHITGDVTVIQHPLVQHKLTLMRQKHASTGEFRRLAREISLLMAYELTRDLPIETTEIETPLETMQAPILAGKKLCIVSILRAGDGIMEGMLDLVPSARVGHIGLYRDPATLVPVEYYLKLPDDIAERLVIVVDPMLATGHSAAAALSRLKQAGATQLRFACLLTVPQGLRVLTEAHPDVPIFTCSIDRELDDHAYIRPGLGDAGDRLYGTK
ncbi:uracil phosphoribosyltransferase [Pseudoroseomonas cervicalis]|uniref:uracil phosphoribosyltransferase n=1 Tax=Teichococcus cervicalis TaxID=204525 RepID=UPI00277E023F|nr:uracil phosphoribosyltransferase [Pseudoroseomonas cervicalis]MDQ1077654.1 uracil phosphoribosyltransferase [Pseudoroseomonas cervicalis]